MKFKKISWSKIERMCKKLAEKIKDYNPDWLIGISRGGLIPVRLLSDYLNISNVAIIRIEFYKTINQTSDFPQITQPLQVDVKDKKILVVDDVVDTGMSIAVAKEHIKRAGAKEVRVASLHYKPKSNLKPDYFIEETESWIVYPWEKEETKRELKKLKQCKQC